MSRIFSLLLSKKGTEFYEPVHMEDIARLPHDKNKARSMVGIELTIFIAAVVVAILLAVFS